jgi:hypothetical protein
LNLELDDGMDEIPAGETNVPGFSATSSRSIRSDFCAAREKTAQYSGKLNLAGLQREDNTPPPKVAKDLLLLFEAHA